MKKYTSPAYSAFSLYKSRQSKTPPTPAASFSPIISTTPVTPSSASLPKQNSDPNLTMIFAMDLFPEEKNAEEKKLMNLADHSVIKLS